MSTKTIGACGEPSNFPGRATPSALGKQRSCNHLRSRLGKFGCFFLAQKGSTPAHRPDTTAYPPVLPPRALKIFFQLGIQRLKKVGNNSRYKRLDESELKD